MIAVISIMLFVTAYFAVRAQEISLLLFIPAMAAAEWAAALTHNQWVGKGIVAVAGALVCWQHMQRSRGHGAKTKRLNLLQRAAVREGRQFFEGAEHWTRRQQLQSCVRFGVFNQMVFYPLVIFPFSLVTALVLMREYRRTFVRTGSREQAVEATAALRHRYSVCTLGALAVILVALLLRTQLFQG